MPQPEYKHCLLCGERFDRLPRRSQAQWDKQLFHTRRCGAIWNAAQRISHGAISSPEYQSWRAMKSRCLNPKATGYKAYGARGVAICDRWRTDFAAFLADMGPRPDGHSLDRIDNDGNYEPGNCRWATPKQQAANRRQVPKSWVQCSADECARRALAKGLCGKHYQRHRKTKQEQATHVRHP
jgi:hypothetical protein